MTLEKPDAYDAEDYYRHNGAGNDSTPSVAIAASRDYGAAEKWPYVDPPAMFEPKEGMVSLDRRSSGRIVQRPGDFVRLRGDTDEIVDKSLWWRLGPLRFNPIVTLLAFFIIWAFILGCIIDPNAGDSFKVAKAWVTDLFTWLYIGSQDIWALFFIWLYFSKYSQIKLGKDDDVPEYNDVTWFFMFFSCGVSVGLFFYGVAEPVYHYTLKSRYSVDYTMPDNTLAQVAMNVTLYHWGIHGWIVYSIIGAILGLVGYRKGLPLTIKSCFWPLIGDKIFGWFGDAIDTISIFTTLFGVCTSLGLGAMQINKGLELFDPENLVMGTIAQVIIVWCITIIATISTVSGVGLGIRRLSEFCFCLGLVLLLSVFFLDNSWYILNLLCQSIGFYFQWILQLGWHTDAFEQSGVAAGGKDRRREYDDGVMDGPSDWMDDWTMFYWGWWIAWSPFVGMFIAKISKGRTLKEFINGTMTAPVAFSFVWLVFFGGSGLLMERTAASYDLCCNDGLNRTLIDDELQHLAANPGAGAPLLQSSSKWMSYSTLKDLCVLDKEGKSECGQCTDKVMHRAVKEIGTMNYTMFLRAIQTKTIQPRRRNIKSISRTYTRLSCLKTEEMWFALMESYDNLGGFLSVLSLCGIILYFVTSSDSGSLVIDCLSANGDPDPPKAQRVFWAMMEGATATALLVAGGKEGLEALQTVSIVMGLPYTIVVCFICVSLYRLLQHEFMEIDLIRDPKFRVSLLDPFCTWNPRLTLSFFVNVLAAPWTVGVAAARMAGSSRAWLYAVPMAFALLLFVVLHACDVALYGLWAMAWIVYLAHAAMVTSVRITARELLHINGNPVEDFFAAMLFYPGVALQLEAAAEDVTALKSPESPPQLLVESPKTIDPPVSRLEGTPNPTFEDDAPKGADESTKF